MHTENELCIMNKVILIGNLGKDPEISTATSERIKVAKLSVATEDGTKDRPKTNWHNVVCWRGIADIAEKYLSKGCKVCVEGYLEYNKFTDKEGFTRHSVNIMAQRIELLEKRQEKTDSTSSSPAVSNDSAPKAAPTRHVEDDGLPF